MFLTLTISVVLGIFSPFYIAYPLIIISFLLQLFLVTRALKKERDSFTSLGLRSYRNNILILFGISMITVSLTLFISFLI